MRPLFACRRSAPAVFVVSIFCSITGNAAAQLFPASQIATGGSSVALASADLNNDGKPDLVTSNSSGNSFTVLIANNSASGYAPGVSYPVAGGPADVALADFNNDGKIDVATANFTNNTFSVFLATTPGVYFAPSTIATASGPNSIVAADVNFDGKPDIIINASNAFSVSVYFGNGLGGFSAPTTYIPGIGVNKQAERQHLGDLNNDGMLDIAVRDSNTSFARALGTAGGGFGAFGPAGMIDVPTDLAIVDFTNDGKRDIVGVGAGFAFLFQPFAFVLPGNGAGGFAPIVKSAWIQAPNRMDYGDFNNDGNLDIATANSLVGGFQIHRVATAFGNGSGGFSGTATYIAGSSPTGIVVKDLNGDGTRDIACSNAQSNTISVLYGTGAGTFKGALGIPTIGIPLGGALGDVNNDGKPDLVYSSYSAPTIYTHLGDGAGGLPMSTSMNIPFGLTSVVLGDMNGDYKLDLIVSGFESTTSTGRAAVALGNGAGGFVSSAVAAANGNDNAVAVYDVNLDGKLDVIVANTTPQQTGVILVYPGDGQGLLGAPISYSVGPPPPTMAVGDINSDGFVDIVTSRQLLPSLSLLLGNGAGGFLPFSILTLPGNSLSPVIADTNGDGNIDILSTRAGGITTFVNNGAGGFTTLDQSYTNSIGAHRSADVNRDGIPDLVCTADNSSIGVMLGIGGGQYGQVDRFAGASLIDITDLNGDGALDTVSLLFIFGAGASTVLLNQTIQPAGIVAYGSGTDGCQGAVTLSTNVTPAVNTPNAAITCVNAPRRSLGLLVIANSPDYAGSNSFGLNALVHLNFATSTEVYTFDMVSDAGGAGFVAAGIPNNPLLIDLHYFAQTYWIENAAAGEHCSTATYGFVTSRGLEAVIQP